MLPGCLVFLLFVTCASARTVVYGALGSFTNDPPFTDPIYRPTAASLLPQSPAIIKTQFFLFTRHNKHKGQQLDAILLNELTTKWTQFDSTKLTKFITHGFLDGGDDAAWMFKIKDELLKEGDYNVIIVNWRGGNKPPFPQAAANTQVVGAEIALLVNTLVKQGNITAKSVHLIGHSLGAHTSGYAGERIVGLGRISGMDPSNPLFTGMDPVVKLDESDALFVDIIHTDATTFDESRLYGLGTLENVGTMDFWPNGGYNMPGCKITKRGQAPKQIDVWKNVTLWTVYGCNHVRSVKYFTESINSRCPFYSFPCSGYSDFKTGRCVTCPPNGCPVMGFHADQRKPPNGQRGTYFLYTSGHSPFCEYSISIQIKLSNQTGAKDVNGKLSLTLSSFNNRSQTVHLNRSPMTFHHGQAYTFFVGVPRDFGIIHTVGVAWQQTIPVTRNAALYVEEVQVYREEFNDKKRFCPLNKEVLPGKVLTTDRLCSP